MNNKYLKSLRQIKVFLGLVSSNLNKEDDSPRYTKLTLDSRDVIKDSIFYAKKGYAVNGLDYVDNAIANGATLVLVDHKVRVSREILKKITVIHLPEHTSISDFAAFFYNYPSEKLKVIGVTGTNGKTTVTNLIAQYLNALNYKCAVLGTIGNGFLDNLKKSKNTTLDNISLQRALYELLQEGATHVAMEVSSIGYVQGRVCNIKFALTLFTNFTRDHLDFHGTMDEYFRCKKDFMENSNAIVVYNASDKKVCELINRSSAYFVINNKDFLSIKQNANKNNCLHVEALSYKKEGIELKVSYKENKDILLVPLIGQYNVENLAAAFLSLLKLGFSFKDLANNCSKLHAILGRMQCFYKEHYPLVVVDYAHTPDGVESVLKSIRPHLSPEASIVCVIGCGGDRDKGKRPIMARKACVYADFAFFTSDNPRSEDPKKILEEMVEGVISSTANYRVIEDRHSAIVAAFNSCKEHDCLVIAGKGHEDYQIFADKTIYFSDLDEARSLLGLKND